MKKRLVAVYCALSSVLLTVSPFVLASENLIENGDLENVGEGQTQVPENFVIKYENNDTSIGQVIVTDKQKAAGQRGLLIERVQENGKFGIVLEAIHIAAGARYTLSFKVKGAEGTIRVAVCPLTDSKQIPDNNILVDSQVSPSFGALSRDGRLAPLNLSDLEKVNDFNSLDFSFTTPEDAAYVSIILTSLSGTEPVWIDELSLIETANATSSERQEKP